MDRGKGHALVTGFREAMKMGYTHAITIDADGQHFADDMPRLTAEMNKQPDGIIVGTEDSFGRVEKSLPQVKRRGYPGFQKISVLVIRGNLPDTYLKSSFHSVSADSDGKTERPEYHDHGLK